MYVGLRRWPDTPWKYRPDKDGPDITFDAMNAKLFVLPSLLSFSGCVTAAAGLACDFAEVHVGECPEEVGAAAEDADLQIIASVLFPDPRLHGVLIEGSIESDQRPVPFNRVELSKPGGVVVLPSMPSNNSEPEPVESRQFTVTVAADARGRYRLWGAVLECRDLLVTFLDVDQRASEHVPVKCGAQLLNFDPASGAVRYQFLGPEEPSPPARVAVSGTITAEGVPMAGLRMELAGALGTIALTVTDSLGQYLFPEIQTRVGECDLLTLFITQPHERTSHQVPIECAPQRLDYDLLWG